jgi:hypothetical protein
VSLVTQYHHYDTGFELSKNKWEVDICPAKHFTLFSRDQNVSKEGLVTFLFTRYNYVKV